MTTFCHEQRTFMESNTTYIKQDRIWRILCRLLGPILKRMLGLEIEPLPDIGPALIICNHVTNIDPILLALSSPRKMLIYVASENILRGNSFLHRLLYRIFSPIPRRKGASAVDTCRKVVRTLRAGRSVCLFAEGETTWNGKTAPIRQGTDVLVRASGASLITYCFSGGYMTYPRWGKGLRRGKMVGRVPGTYSAEQVRAMSPDDLRRVMDSGIAEDAFQRQHACPVPYRGRHRMEHVESLLFLCPQCHQIGTLSGKEDAVTCSCGLSVSFDACLLPSEPSPFADLYAWDQWQVSAFAEMVKSDSCLTIRESDSDICLWEIADDNTMSVAAQGTLSMNAHALTVGGADFPLSGIQDLALLQVRKAAFTYENRYFELQSPRPLCLRKYLLFWQNARHLSDNI